MAKEATAATAPAAPSADWLKEVYKSIGENDANQDVKDWLSTGFLPLNKALSGRYDGGLPVGRIIEIFGAESSGKTLMATMAMIETQKKDGIAIFEDYEHAFYLRYAQRLGLSIDPKKWIYKQPETAEQGFDMLDKAVNIVRKHAPAKHITAIVDSVASMITDEEMKTGYGEGNMRTRLSLPAVMSENLKKLSKLVSDTNITLIFLNQTRTNPGVMFGDPEKTSGGNALKFYASVRVKLSKTGKVKGDDGNTIIGEKVKAQVIKNKVFEPFREAEYTTHFDIGINLPLSHIDYLIDAGKIEKSGAWYSFEGEKVQGKEKLVELIAKDPKHYEKILKAFSE